MTQPTISHSNKNLLAVIRCTGVKVNLFKNPCNAQQVLGEFEDTQQTRKIILDYDNREVLSSAMVIFQFARC